MRQLFIALFFTFYGLGGVFGQFNWQYTNGPSGTHISLLDANDSYAFCPQEYNLYRTTNGIDWEATLKGNIFNMNHKGDTLIALISKGHVFKFGNPTNLAISYDNGNNWSERALPSKVYPGIDMVMCDHGIYIPYGQESIIYHSIDEGVTWDTVSPPTTYIYNMYCYDNRLYVSNGYNQIWRTDKNGKNWTKMPLSIPDNSYIDEIYVDKNHIIVCSDENAYISTDDGQSWIASNMEEAKGISKITRVGNYLYGIGLYNVKIVKSEDFGVTWETLINDWKYYFYSIISINNKVLVSGNNGVQRLDETTNTLVKSENGINNAAVTGFIPLSQDKLGAFQGYSLPSYYKIDTKEWQPFNSPVNQMRSFASGKNGFYAAVSSLNDNIYITKDYGITWDSVSAGNQPGWSFNSNKVYIVDDVVFAFLSDENYYRSEDYGQTWTMVAIPNDLSTMNTKLILFNYKNKFYAKFYDDIYTSSDRGLTWNLAYTFPYGLLFGFKTAGDLLLASSYTMLGVSETLKVFVSEDGITWRYATDGMPQMGIDLEVPFEEHHGFFEYKGTYYFYDDESGFYGSTDTCRTWIPLEYRPYHTVTLFDSLFFASNSYGGGVISSTVPDMNIPITGMVYSDENNNGIRDNNEPPLLGAQIRVSNSDSWRRFYFTTTNSSGEYRLPYFMSGSDTITPFLPSTHIKQINPSFYLTGGTQTNKDFGIYLEPGVVDLSVSGNLVGRPRPGLNLGTYINCENLGTVYTSGTLSYKLDPKLQFISADPTPSAIIGDSLVWDIQDLDILNSKIIYIESGLSPSVAIGLPVDCKGYFNTTLNDINLSNNILILNDTIVGSYDPNMKQVFPTGDVPLEYVKEGKEFIYTIQFQNTGTYQADKVRITDMIDTALDYSTLRFVSASHEVSSFQLLPGGLLEVVFNNINLPDSNSNEALSHGFVSFAIQKNKVYTVEKPVKNTAAIYFDYNEPIFTNEVVFNLKPKLIAVEDFSKNTVNNYTISPNPASQYITIRPAFSSVGFKRNSNFILTDLSGKIRKDIKLPFSSQESTIDVSLLTPGTYFWHIVENNQNVSNGKIVVIR